MTGYEPDWGRMLAEKQTNRRSAQTHMVRALNIAELEVPQPSEEMLAFTAGLSDPQRIALICDLAHRHVRERCESRQAFEALAKKRSADHLFFLLLLLGLITLQVLR